MSWISVKDAKPESRQDCWVSSGRGHVTAARYKGETAHRDDIYGPLLFDPLNLHQELIVGVTHWRPMEKPDPPEPKLTVKEDTVREAIEMLGMLDSLINCPHFRRVARRARLEIPRLRAALERGE